MSIDFSALNRETIAPASRQDTARKGNHVVGFYEDKEALATSAGSFLERSLAGGGAAIIVATAEHRSAIHDYLEGRGFDLKALAEQGLFKSVDARATLDMITHNGDVAPLIFTEVIGGLISQASLRRNPVRIYGEMVALMWADDDRAGALHLEQVWNLLARIHSFDLLCGYPVDKLLPDHMPDVTSVCGEHTHVIAPS